MWRFKFAAAVALALLPSWIKNPLYRRLFGYQIGKGVQIGFAPFVGVGRCRIGDHVRIGSFNLFDRVADLEVGEGVRVGFLNLFRGGDRVRIGRYATVLRQNVFNAIIDRDFVEPVASILELGDGVVVTTGHWLDFSAGLTVGGHTIIGGRNSSLWTHNRQRGRPIRIGAHCYLGSEVRVAPGVEVPPLCIVALDSVLSGRYPETRSLIGGNPGKVLRALREDDLFLVARKTRNDIPDEVVFATLPFDLHAKVGRRAKEPIGDGPTLDLERHEAESPCVESRASST